MTTRSMIGWFVLAAAAPLFFVDFVHGRNGPWLEPLLDPAHLLFFGCGGVLLMHSWEWLRAQTFARQALWVAIAAAAVGGLIELLQVPTALDASLGDVGRDVEGALAAVMFLAPARMTLRPLPRHAAQAFLAAAVIAEAAPGAAVLLDCAIAAYQFPVLAGFETPFERGRWTNGVVVNGPVRTGRASLQVNLTTERYSGTTLRRFLGDWRGYRSLRIRLYNAGPGPLPITVKVFDEDHALSGSDYHDRYNGVYPLAPGWNDLGIALADIARAPRTRTMDLGRIAGFQLFAVRLPAPRRLYIGEVYLAP